MGIFDKSIEKAIRKISIQGSTEGSTTRHDIESLFYSSNASTSVPGIVNSYTVYESQVENTYKKYNGEESFGNSMVRTIIDFRTAFIAGEGISVSCKDERTAKWINNLIKHNKLNGSSLIKFVKGAEMSGQGIALLEPEEDTVNIYRKPYDYVEPYRAVYDKETNKLVDVQVKKTGSVGWVSLNLKNYVYIRTGGDDRSKSKPSTKTGVVLTDIDNYDRAIKDIRRNNHIFARVTPVFETDTASEAKNLKTWLSNVKWKIGTTFIGKAKFRYESPTTTVYKNIESELTSVVKTISSVTGVPVHWMGYVDLMSNRSTAESLYEVIKNATLNERTIWEEALYDIILKAQEVYINEGGTEITLNRDFEVKLPLIDFSNFYTRVQALSLAHGDGAISMDDYRNALPGINPLDTERTVKIEQEESLKQLIKFGVPSENKKQGEE